MTILSQDILTEHGPYIEFADCPSRLAIGVDDWPARSLYEQYMFFEFADDLTGILCSLTHNYLFFKKYEFTQIDNPHEILSFGAVFLQWAIQLMRCRTFDYEKELLFYDNLPSVSENNPLNAVDLQHDLIETLLFIAGRLNRIAYEKRCLVIVGI